MRDEQFVTPTEMMGYCNEAIDEAEAEIMKLHEDYFLKSEAISLVTGTASYDMPSDIYAQKIRALIWSDGTRWYQPHRIRSFNKFLRITSANENINTEQDYQWFIKNPDVDTGYQMVLAPPARETSSTVMTLWYIRNAHRVTSSEQVIDIPEFANFIMTYMKAACMAKENAGVIPPTWAERVAQQRKQMIDTLTQMVPDDEDEVEGDFSHYMEHS